MASMLRLAGFLTPYRWRVAAALAALLVAAGCVLALGQGLKLVVDAGFGSGEPRLLDQALGALVAVAVTLSVATYFRFRLMMSTGERVITDIRRAVFGHLLDLSPGFFEVTRTGEPGESVNGRSVLSLLSLAAAFGTRLRVRAVGIDAEKAVAALGQVLEQPLEGEGG